MIFHSRSNTPLNRLIHALALLGTIYGLVMSLFLVVRKTLTEDNKLVSVFNAFAHLLMLPALMLLPISVMVRRPWLGLLNLIPSGVFLQAYARYFGPRPAAGPTPATRLLNVLTYNLHSETTILEPMVRILRECDADIISVQELSREAADCFKNALHKHYPYQALHTNHHANSGQGVFSRFPITDEHYWRNPHIATRTLGHLRVQLDVNGTTITLYNAHPIHPGMGDDGFSSRPRGAEIDVMLAKAARDSGPILIMGDFNMTDQSEDYEHITRRFGDSFAAVGSGMGFTFPDLTDFQSLPGYWPLPIRLFRFLRLDYIFHNAYFRPLQAHVWATSGGSDHRPVFARLALMDEPTA